MPEPSALSQILGFVLFLAFVGGLAAIFLHVVDRFAPEQEPEASRFDELDRPRPGCATTGRHYFASDGPADPMWRCACGELFPKQAPKAVRG